MQNGYVSRHGCTDVMTHVGLLDSEQSKSEKCSKWLQGSPTQHHLLEMRLTWHHQVQDAVHGDAEQLGDVQSQRCWQFLDALAEGGEHHVSDGADAIVGNGCPAQMPRLSLKR